MIAYYLNIKPIRDKVRHATHEQLLTALLHAGEELDLVYSECRLATPTSDIDDIIAIIISDLRRLLIRVVPTDVLVVKTAILKPGGLIYVIK